jgi:hypothetical protein
MNSFDKELENLSGRMRLKCDSLRCGLNSVPQKRHAECSPPVPANVAFGNVLFVDVISSNGVTLE